MSFSKTVVTFLEGIAQEIYSCQIERWNIKTSHLCIQCRYGHVALHTTAGWNKLRANESVVNHFHQNTTVQCTYLQGFFCLIVQIKQKPTLCFSRATTFLALELSSLEDWVIMAYLNILCHPKRWYVADN